LHFHENYIIFAEYLYLDIGQDYKPIAEVFTIKFAYHSILKT